MLVRLFTAPFDDLREISTRRGLHSVGDTLCRLAPPAGTCAAARDGISRRDLHIHPTVTGGKLQHVADKRHYAQPRDPNEAPSQWGDQNARTRAQFHTSSASRASVDAFAEDAPPLGLALSASPPRVIWGGTISSGRPTSASPQPRSRRPAQWWCRRSEAAVDPMGQAAALLCQGLHHCVP